MLHDSDSHHVVILGGGFGGLYAAKALGNAPLKVTLVDKRNFHLFQPLLYQIATGGLSPGDIASPLRAVLNKYKNITVYQSEIVDIKPENQRVILADSELQYDILIVATGTRHYYFGNEGWKEKAPGLKTVEDALEMRRRIFQAFEAAEHEMNPEKRTALITFVIVGGGPTGVELAGALAELAHKTLTEDFRNINPAETQILLLEGTDRLLPSYPVQLSRKAESKLAKLGVSILTGTFLVEIKDDSLKIRKHDSEQEIHSHTVLWAAGVKASGIGEMLAKRTGANIDRSGRVIVEEDLSVPGFPNLFVIGDLAHFKHRDGNPLPGVAPVAMQQGRYVARLIKKRLQNQSIPAFKYRNKGNLAVIGRNAAIADFGWLRLSGFPAWLIWIFVHIAYLIEFDNKILVLFQWAWNYFTRKRGARLITGDIERPKEDATSHQKGM